MDFALLTLDPAFRWLHILAGIVWIGHLYFFNFVNGPFAATMSGDTKKLVVPELMPRALYWFRWGAAWTWGTGVILLLLVFYHGGLVPMSMGAVVSLALTFGGFAIYDAIMTTSIISDVKMKYAVCYVLVALSIFIMTMHAGMSERAFNIHIGAMFGTVMAFNVWFRIWPAQQQIITAVKNGQAPDAQLVAMAGLRSRHNTYLSAALVWTMIGMHTSGFLINVPPFSIRRELVLLMMILVAWHVVFQLYKRAAKIKGF